MAQPVPAHLATSTNQLVLAYISGLSAHSDVVDVLMEAIKPLGDVQAFCPDLDRYRYVLASTRDVVLGFAAGNDTVASRLDERMKAKALTTGGEEYPQCGKEWVAVVHRLADSDWPEVDVAFWARQAFIYARDVRP